MDRVFEFVVGLLLLGVFAIAKFGLYEDVIDFMQSSPEPAPDTSYMTAASPWSKDYDPAVAARHNVYYENCAAARAAGAAPIRIGQPGYGIHLDRDGDGIACEPYRGRR